MSGSLEYYFVIATIAAYVNLLTHGKLTPVSVAFIFAAYNLHFMMTIQTIYTTIVFLYLVLREVFLEVPYCSPY